MATHEALLNDAIVPWAQSDPNVRGLAEIGSRVRDTPADEWADMDLLIVVEDKAKILDDDGWIDAIGTPWVALRHPGPLPGLPVRQILFAGALDFDVVPVGTGTLASLISDGQVAALFGSGYEVLVDKDGELAGVDLSTRQRPPVPADIAAADFDFVVGDFLFQTVWASKHLRRGEIWAAKDDVDCYMKAGLVRMTEWHTISHRPGTMLRAGGRYIEQWADPRFLAGAADMFASYDAPGVAVALMNMIEVFRWLGTETARALGFTYPEHDHDAVTAWVRGCLAPYLDD